MSEKIYASVSDIMALGISLTAQQQEAAQILLEAASAKLRLIAAKNGRSIDALIDDEHLGADYETAVRNTIVQAAARALNSITDSAPAATQNSETNGSYSYSMTYLNAGQSLYFLRNELKELGLLRQTYGAIELYDLSGG